MYMYDIGKLEYVGTWERGREIKVYNIDGELVALSGWNGEIYTDCWKCKNLYEPSEGFKPCYARPVYRYDIEAFDIDWEDDSADEWAYATEIVYYSVWPGPA